MNPVVVMENALRERGDAIAGEFFASCTLGAGQFCTNPGFVIVPASEAGKKFVETARKQFRVEHPECCSAKAAVIHSRKL